MLALSSQRKHEVEPFNSQGGELSCECGVRGNTFGNTFEGCAVTMKVTEVMLGYLMVFLRGIPNRWRRSHKLFREMPSLRARSVSVMLVSFSKTKWKK